MDDYKALIKETIRQLDTIMDSSVAQMIKDVGKKAIGRSVRTKDPMFWPSGMLMLGLVSALDLIDDEDKETADKIRRTIKDHIALWNNKYGGRILYIDDALAGYSLIRFNEKENDDTVAKVIRDIESYISDTPRDRFNSIIYNPGRNSRNIFVDGIGQTVSFMAADVLSTLSKAGDSFDNQTNSEVHYYNESGYLAIISDVYTQLMNFYIYGRDDRSGLIYHGYSISDEFDQDKDQYVCDKKGILGWGRAIGWLFMGLNEAAAMEKKLSSLSKVAREWSVFDIIPWYLEMVRVALHFQRQDGGWSWQIEGVEGHIDMSATGMIAYCLASGLRRGLIDDENLADRVRASLNLAGECMCKNIQNGIVTNALSSCDDFAVHYQTYGNYPWGQGAVLAALSEIKKLKI